MNKHLKYFSGTFVGLVLSISAFVAAGYAVVLKTLSSPFRVDIKRGTEDETKTLGVSVDILASPSEDDFQFQLQPPEDLSNRSYKGTTFAPLPLVNLAIPAVHAWKKGIYLVDFDEEIDTDSLKKAGGNVKGPVATDNAAIGARGMSFIIDKLGAGGGEVAIIESKADNASDKAHRNGVTEAFKKVGQIKLVTSQPADWDRTKALDVAINMLQRNPNTKATYCTDDAVVMGVVQAVANAGKTGKVLIVGTDGISEVRRMVETGQVIATVAQNPVNIGVTSLKLTVSTEKFDKVIPLDKTLKSEPVDLILVTQ